MKFYFPVLIHGNFWTSEHRYVEVAKCRGNNSCKFSTSRYHFSNVVKSPGIVITGDFKNFGRNFISSQSWNFFLTNFPSFVTLKSRNFQVMIPGDFEISGYLYPEIDLKKTTFVNSSAKSWPISKTILGLL